MYALSLANPTADNFKLEYEIVLAEFADAFKIKKESRGKFYERFRKMVWVELIKKNFTYFCEEEKKEIKMLWFASVAISEDKRIVSVMFNPLLKNHLHKISKRFTSYFLENVAEMKSPYSVRIYEMAILHLNASKSKEVTFDKGVGDLKTRLGIDNEIYQDFKNLRSWVLNKAIDEIGKYSDIIVTYTSSKSLRKPHIVHFNARFKNKNNLHKNDTNSVNDDSVISQINGVKTLLDHAKTTGNKKLIEGLEYDLANLKKRSKS